MVIAKCGLGMIFLILTLHFKMYVFFLIDRKQLISIRKNYDWIFSLILLNIKQKYIIPEILCDSCSQTVSI